jgi:hypothetical protein
VLNIRCSYSNHTHLVRLSLITITVTVLFRAHRVRRYYIWCTRASLLWKYARARRAAPPVHALTVSGLNPTGQSVGVIITILHFITHRRRCTELRLDEFNFVCVLRIINNIIIIIIIIVTFQRGSRTDSRLRMTWKLRVYFVGIRIFNNAFYRL